MLSQFYTWVHIIKNEIKFYRKRDKSKMVAKLSTTIEKSQNLPYSSPNSITLNEFLFYMDNYSSERHPRIIIIIF